MYGGEISIDGENPAETLDSSSSTDSVRASREEQQSRIAGLIRRLRGTFHAVRLTYSRLG